METHRVFLVVGVLIDAQLDTLCGKHFVLSIEGSEHHHPPVTVSVLRASQESLELTDVLRRSANAAHSGAVVQEGLGAQTHS